MRLPILLPCLALGLGLAHAYQPADPAQTLWLSRPAKDWENEGLPLGNGTMGAVIMGGAEKGILQFTVDSLWTGNENASGGYKDKGQSRSADSFGSFQNFGELSFAQQFPSPGTVSVSVASGHAPSTPQEDIDRSADGDPKSKWCVIHGGKPVVWQVSLGDAKRVESYAFTSAGDVPGRDPYTWLLEGSTDGTSWGKVDERSGVAPHQQRHQAADYRISKPGSFRHYRITFQPRPGVEHFQVGEISLAGINLAQAKNQAPEGYYRALDIQNSIHTESWQAGGVTYTREAIASFPARVVAWRFTASKPGAVSGTLVFTGAHPDLETVRYDPNTIAIDGKLDNDLAYAGRVKVLTEGGKVTSSKDGIRLEACNEALVLLAADTNFVMDSTKQWKSGDPAKVVDSRMKRAVSQPWQSLLAEHNKDYRSLYDRVSLDLGKSSDKARFLPVNERIDLYRQGAKELPRPCLDPELEVLLFQYGRYLLISCSRPGTLPATLQGVWNHSNAPAWFSDYHSNINIQMNYWLAETTNLSELAQPLFDMLSAGAPVYAKHTKEKYGPDTVGFVTRMSINPFGGSGWNWNIEGTAWLAQHFWDHYAFNRDKEFLKTTAWPWLRDVSKFWLGHLKELPDGKLVVPNVWSHEHGPYEDGTAHAQQLMWDLFGNTIAAAEILGEEPALAAKLKDSRARLHGPQIGSWGQLMEWMAEKPDLEKSNHRHTSHLFGVFPGNQINRNTPEWLEGARVSLTKRGEVGDSRRSWTWAWRTALWSRMGDPSRAHGCVAGLLAYNMLDNLWTTHPPFQIDGNYGITAGMAEMFLQSQSGAIELLPALPKNYPAGTAKGLRARGEVIVDQTWKDGKLVAARLTSPIAQEVSVLAPGDAQPRKVKLAPGQPVTLKP